MTTLLTAFSDTKKGTINKATVEVDIRPGVGIHLVGLADAAVKESLLRVITAMESCGYRFPGQKVIINIAPAALRKTGEGFDLPIALGILLESGQVKFDPEGFIFHGELRVDGAIRLTGQEQAIMEKGQLRGAFVCGKRPTEDEGYEFNDGHYGFGTLRELINYAEYVWND
jgi:magnesium chelatase family protein